MDRLGSLPMGIPGGVENRLVVQKSGWKARIMTFQGNAVVEAGKNNFLSQRHFSNQPANLFRQARIRSLSAFYLNIDELHILNDLQGFLQSEDRRAFEFYAFPKAEVQLLQLP